MQKVDGFGGFFFRSNDPETLAKWYHEHLGISPVPQGASDMPWISDAGPVVFAPFPSDTSYFATDKACMLNFRVSDLDAMLDQLRAADIPISHQSEMEGIGRFARIHDPEDNPIELWEPVSG
jgi:predicted enzyme related to lactoylglutathione lyase